MKYKITKTHKQSRNYEFATCDCFTKRGSLLWQLHSTGVKKLLLAAVDDNDDCFIN